jgi:lysozyme family protein
MSETTPRAISTSPTVPSYGNFWKEAAKWWDMMERNKLSMAQSVAKKILSNKARYQNVESKTGVPWYWIGPTHFRESDCDFSTQLAQGDPLGKKSTHVPKGQGPYFGPDAWDRAALIALETDKLNQVKDWRLEKLFYWWESYNGWGYRLHGTPSAYVWAGTNIYTAGFYVADGHWSATARDSRVGCVPVLKCLVELDSTISIQRESENESDPPVWVGKPPGGVEPIEPPVKPPVEPDGKHEIVITIEDGKVVVKIDGVERT